MRVTAKPAATITASARRPIGISSTHQHFYAQDECGGNDWSARFPLVIEVVNYLKVRSCLIDGEVVCCDERGLSRSTYCAAVVMRPGRFSTLPNSSAGRMAKARGTCGGREAREP